MFWSPQRAITNLSLFLLLSNVAANVTASPPSVPIGAKAKAMFCDRPPLQASREVCHNVYSLAGETVATQLIESTAYGGNLPDFDSVEKGERWFLYREGPADLSLTTLWSSACHNGNETLYKGGSGTGGADANLRSLHPALPPQEALLLHELLLSSPAGKCPSV